MTRRGITRAVLTAGGHIDPAAWRHHVDTLQPVGTCPRCPGLLRPGPAYVVGDTTWFAAECAAPGCGYETAAREHRPAK